MSLQEKNKLGGVVKIDKEIMHGTPCFTGTRVPVQTLLDYLEAGDTLSHFLKDYPRVKRKQAIQFLELAKEQLLQACVSS